MHLPVEDGEPLAKELPESQVRHFKYNLYVQMVVCFLRIWVLWDALGGFLMAMTIALGWYAHREHLNISLVSVWGAVNGVQALWDTISGAFSAIFNVITFQFTNVILLVLVPLTELFAAALAWEFVMHHDAKGGPVAHLWEDTAAAYGAAKPFAKSVEATAAGAVAGGAGTQQTLAAAALRLAGLAAQSPKKGDAFLSA
mmetsp:Transcript_144476/g.402489  ORF Transcript_144476/g.402489 Transcript_144476/m.402489 type:complete len:199 (-) Transcript_144476:123-719(-)